MEKITYLLFIFLLLTGFSIAAVSLTNAASSNKVSVIILYKDVPDELDVDDLERIGADIRYTYDIIPGIAANIEATDINDIEADEDVSVVFL